MGAALKWELWVFGMCLSRSQCALRVCLFGFSWKILGDQTEDFFKPSQLGCVAIDSLNLAFVLGHQNSDHGRLKIYQSDVPSLAAEG